MVIWHMLSKGEEYIWSRPALLDWKLRKLELTAGYPSHRGGRIKGPAADYSLKSVRDQEREAVGHAEEVYRRFVTKWKQPSPKAKPISPQ
ncbi:hypothetical protein [uncultured Ruegeria sp.]|uniref:hypothetical protein n=1 Tax=uncultured Ruegeria sp. TaxID=259304 RepID=UPI00262B491B|nr:hypothetical protein [uncultured Ruegeria sp.]